MFKIYRVTGVSQYVPNKAHAAYNLICGQNPAKYLRDAQSLEDAFKSLKFGGYIVKQYFQNEIKEISLRYIVDADGNKIFTSDSPQIIFL